MKKFNINDPIYIQITSEGWEYLKETVGEYYILNCIEVHRIKIEEEIWYKLQCYEVFSILPVSMDKSLLFKSNILFDKSNLK